MGAFEDEETAVERMARIRRSRVINCRLAPLTDIRTERPGSQEYAAQQERLRLQRLEQGEDEDE
jgi:hypothetical protein